MRHLLKFFAFLGKLTWHSSGIRSTFLMCTNIFNIIRIMRNIRLYIKGLVLRCECNYSLWNNNTIMCHQISCSNFRYIVLPFKWFTMVWSTPVLFRGECKIKDVWETLFFRIKLSYDFSWVPLRCFLVSPPSLKNPGNSFCFKALSHFRT